MLEEKGSTLLKSGTTIAELIRRPELNYEDLAPIDKERPELPWDVKQQVEINLKYEGYIKRQLKQVEQFKKLEAKKFRKTWIMKRLAVFVSKQGRNWKNTVQSLSDRHLVFQAYLLRISLYCWFILNNTEKFKFLRIGGYNIVL